MTSTEQAPQTEAERNLVEARRASVFIDGMFDEHVEAGHLLGQADGPEPLGYYAMTRIIGATGNARWAKHLDMTDAGVWASITIQDPGGIFIEARRVFIPWVQIARVEQIIGA